MSRNKKAARRRGTIFASFFMCCLGASLVAAAMATKNWFESDCKSSIPSSTGTIHFGLFQGSSILVQEVISTKHNLKVVCEDGSCMYSCADTKALRIDQLHLMKNNTKQSTFVNEHCQRLEAVESRRPLLGVSFPAISGHSPMTLFPDFLVRRWHSLFDMPLAEIKIGGTTESTTSEDQNSTLEAQSTTLEAQSTTLEAQSTTLEAQSTTLEAQSTTLEAQSTTLEAQSTTLEAQSTTPKTNVDPEFMDYGLWMGTIVCLSLAMLFAVVGALFAVINTATTPVEAITGVPGLYLWNALAALFNMICVILWAVQFHKHLSGNVLLYDAQDGWTTDGMGVFGYSYWLVVVAIFVHVVNIGIIFIGTYEPKIKEQLQAPDAKGGNIMLY